MTVEKYTVSLENPKAELIYEIDYGIISRERFHILNELWAGSSERLSHFNGDPVAATLAMTSNAAIQASFATGCKDREGIIDEMRNQIGYTRLDGLSGIELIEFSIEADEDNNYQVENLSVDETNWWKL